MQEAADSVGSSRMLKICFVHLDSYPVLTGAQDTTYLGGESVQHSLLARSFEERGHTVSAVVADFGQPDSEQVSGIDVIKAYDRNAGLPGVRFLYPRLTSLWSALKKANADVYYQSCASAQTGIIAEFCRRFDRFQVYRVAHDSDCIPGEQLIRFWRDRKIYEYGLRRAGLLAAQTETQQRLLRDNYRLNSTIVNMIVEEPAEDLSQRRDIDVLWVNNFRPFKSPEKLLGVARMCPELNFVMIGGPCPGLEDYYQDVIRQARDIPNLKATGAVPYSEVNSYFARARIFLNTSDSEGFPNSFLQAWIRGVPVVSFFDPDGLIAKESLGITVETVDQMSASLMELSCSVDRLDMMSDHVRSYTSSRYSAGAVVEHYEKLIEASS